VSALPASSKWWRYPIKPPKTLALDHTRLRGKNRAKHPARVFTTKECRAYVPAEFRGHRDGLLDSRTCDSPHVAKQKQRCEEASRLVIKGTWTFPALTCPTQNAGHSRLQNSAIGEGSAAIAVARAHRTGRGRIRRRVLRLLPRPPRLAHESDRRAPLRIGLLQLALAHPPLRKE